MRRALLTILIVLLSAKGISQEAEEAKRYRKGQAAGYATRDATVLSMMGWGLGLAIGIAALCALIENNSGASTSSSSGTSSH